LPIAIPITTFTFSTGMQGKYIRLSPKPCLAPSPKSPVRRPRGDAKKCRYDHFNGASILTNFTIALRIFQGSNWNRFAVLRIRTFFGQIWIRTFGSRDPDPRGYQY
jgi:hypothetical protein